MRISIFLIFLLMNYALSAKVTKPEISDSIALTNLIKKQKGLVAFWNFSDTTGKPIAGSAKEVKLLAFGQRKFTKEGPLSGNSIELDGQKD